MFFTWAMRPALVCPAPSGPWQEAQFLVQLSLASAENAGVAPSMKTAAAHAGIVILFIGVVSLAGRVEGPRRRLRHRRSRLSKQNSSDSWEPGEVGAGDAADGAHWHPVFGEVDALPRLQERIGFLVAHQPSLHLDVGAVVVGEGAPPVETVGIHAPRPDLLGGQIGVVGIVGDAGLRLGMVDAHERFAAAVYELGNRTARLVAYHAQVDSGRVDRPGFHLGETVAGGPSHGIPDFRVVPHEIG